MFRLGNHHCGVGFIALVAGALAALAGSQMLSSPWSSGPHLALAELVNLADEPELPAVPVATVRPASQMNAAISTGQFEELVRPTPVPTVTPTAIPTPMPSPTATPTATLFETGLASTYGEGDGFEGHLTACGQVFHADVVQVAHKSLPCGTLVRVEDSASGRSVTARVTDRGPYIAGRIIDLSWSAFQQLDPTAPGLLKVDVYILDQ